MARPRASSAPSPSQSSARSSSASCCARSRGPPVADAAGDEPLAGEVVQICRAVFGESLIGAYLHGSAVLGGLTPTSDLDVLAIIDRPTTAAERRSIVDGLLAISGARATRGPARPVELTIVQQSQVRPWQPSPVVELVYGEWLRDALSSGEIPDAGPMPDLAPEVVLALRGDRALFGPPPAEVLDPVPPAALRRAVVAGVPSLLADLDADQRNVLLTLARVVATLETDEILPKDAAAELVAHRLPPGPTRDVLLIARQMYLDGIDDEQAGAAWSDSKPTAQAAAAQLVGEIASFEPD